MRLNLKMSPAARDRLEALYRETEADSLADVVRRSLAVYAYLWRRRSEGANILIQQGDSPAERLVLLEAESV